MMIRYSGYISKLIKFYIPYPTLASQICVTVSEFKNIRYIAHLSKIHTVQFTSGIIDAYSCFKEHKIYFGIVYLNVIRIWKYTANLPIKA
jgi:hypothetical protein